MDLIALYVRYILQKIPPGRLLYYKCKICNFTENSSLRKCTNMRRHVMAHLNYKRYRCKYCDFASTTTCMTKGHVKRRHPGKMVTYIDDKVAINALSL